MLLAILSHVREGGWDAVVAADFGSYQDRASYGLSSLLWEDGLGRSRIAAAMMSRKFRRAFGLVSRRELDMVLDASGFAYGDQWGDRQASELEQSVKVWRRHGTKVVLLPQAFGPFEDASLRRKFLSACDGVSLIYARDAISYSHLEQIGISKTKLRLAPDFTNLVPAIVPCGSSSERKSVCFVPNYRMLDKTDATVREHYVPRLAECIRRVVQKGYDPFVLIHDAKEDERIVPMLESGCGEQLRVERESNPRKLKGILGTCHAVIGSRYHALVSALSQSIPSIGFGWSHKYDMLFEDFGCANCSIAIDNSGSLGTHVDSILFESLAGPR